MSLAGELLPPEKDPLLRWAGEEILATGGINETMYCVGGCFDGVNLDLCDYSYYNSSASERRELCVDCNIRLLLYVFEAPRCSVSFVVPCCEQTVGNALGNTKTATSSQSPAHLLGWRRENVLSHLPARSFW